MPTAQTTDKPSFGPFGDSTKEKKYLRLETCPCLEPLLPLPTWIVDVVDVCECVDMSLWWWKWVEEKDEISSKFISNSESCDYGSFLSRRKFIFFLKPLTSKAPSPQRHVNTSTCVVNKHRLRLRLGMTTGARDVLEPQVFFFFHRVTEGL